MCTANNMAFGIGSVGQLVGGIMAGKANQAYHNANAEYLTNMNTLNQIQANQAIDSVQYTGGMQSSQIRNKGISLSKTQKASMASHGLSQSATYQNILDDSIYRSERDAMAVMYNADIQAKNIRTNAALQQAQMLSQAAQERAAGKIAYRTGLLSSIGQFADSWSKWSQTGMAGYGRSKNGGMTSASGSGYGGQWAGVNARNIPVQSYDYLYSVNNSKSSYQGRSGYAFGGGSGSLWR